MADLTFVFNPSSQSGSSGDRWEALARTADELSITYERQDTLPDGATIGLARELAASGAHRVLACVGGDGTVSEVVQGIMEARDRHGVPRDRLPALAIVPFGTGNNIAKSFGIPAAGSAPNALRRAIETARYGADFPLDLGKIDGHYFADAFSIGVDSSILHERNVEREKVRRNAFLRQFLRDYALYFYVSLRFPWLHRNVPATIEMDGDRTVHVDDLTNLVINNTKVYAGEFEFLEDSRANDGLLDVILFTGWRDYLSKFIVAARISPLNPRMLEKVMVRHSENFKARWVRVRLDRDMSCQVDGEERPAGRSFEVACVADAMTMKTPVP